LIETRRLAPLEQSLLRLKRMQQQAVHALEALQAALPADMLDEKARLALEETRRRLLDCRRQLSGGMENWSNPTTAPPIWPIGCIIRP
jgi:two-component system sensor histidine kinase and response regulator WspE